MVKLTKRKGFNFFRSYFDVYNELDDKNKVAFIDALFNRQFLGIKPTELTGMAKFAYISQTNSIDSQVRGYEDKTGTTLLPPSVGGAIGGCDGGRIPPTLQVQEKEKEKVQDVYTEKEFLYDWNMLRKQHLKKPSHLNRIGTMDERENFNDLIKDYSRDDFINALIGLFKQQNLPNGNTSMQSNPKHFLKFFESYITAYHDKNRELYGKKIEQE